MNTAEYRDGEEGDAQEMAIDCLDALDEVVAGFRDAHEV